MGRQSKTQALADATVAVVDALREHWPLTLRQVYYRLVAAGVLENTRSRYQALSALVTDLRKEGAVPWDAIEDRARRELVSDGWQSARDFMRDQAADFLAGYRRDLLQTQERRPLIVVEKDALTPLIHRSAFDYCVPVVVGRGYSSTTQGRWPSSSTR